MAEGGAERQRGGQIKADDDARLWREPQLAGAAEDYVPRLPAGVGQRLVLMVGAEAAFRARVTVGARPVQRGTVGAISRAPAEVPSA